MLKIINARKVVADTTVVTATAAAAATAGAAALQVLRIVLTQLNGKCLIITK